MLIDRGFVRVRPLLGGIDAWADAGFAVETLEQATGLARPQFDQSKGARE
jgi:hypothetical protein